MFGLEAGHAREMTLESDLEARYVWLTREKIERLDMSGLRAEHVRTESLESG
jgi:hypothetical protein